MLLKNFFRVYAIFSVSDLQAILFDQKMDYLVAYAKKIEADQYEKANSRSEYFHLIAKNIYQIKKKLGRKTLDIK